MRVYIRYTGMRGISVRKRSPRRAKGMFGGKVPAGEYPGISA